MGAHAAREACICVMAKAPRAGEVKTRLAPAVGALGAARLAAAFLADTLASVREVPWARPILATTEASVAGAGVEVWEQGGGDLGARLARVLAHALDEHPLAFVVGGDSPGLHPRVFDSARERLRHADAVIGPCEDGGFYLLGLRRCPEGLLAGIEWSRPDTLARTAERLRARGLAVEFVAPGFDVDTPEDLARLDGLLARGELRAPETAEALRELGVGERLAPRAPVGEPGRLRLSVVIPAWQEAGQIAECVRAAAAIGDEVIVADARSTDGTAELASGAGARVVQAPRGRGAQLDAGARASAGEALLFLHADARLPPGARAAISAALARPGIVGGNFLLRFDPPTTAARFYGWANDARRRLLRIYYGDSALFVRRSAYEAIGGFEPLPIMEDYEFVRRLERFGRTAYVRDVVVCASARRFAHAPLRTLAIWAAIQGLYSLGVPAGRLARLYADAR